MDNLRKYLGYSISSIGSAARSIKPTSIQAAARLIQGRRGIPVIRIAIIRAQAIPPIIRNLGITQRWLKFVDNGHIKPVSRFPELANNPKFQTWEWRQWNQSNGAKNFSKEYAALNQTKLNIHTISTVSQFALARIKKASIYAAAIESPFAAVEEIMAVRRGCKTTGAALYKGICKVGEAAGCAAITNGIVIASSGAGITLGPALAGTLGVAGGIVFLGSSFMRLKEIHEDQKVKIFQRSSCSDSNFIDIKATAER